jgi:hypothetical protein
MADLNQPTNKENLLEEPRKLPDTLNVLTILTFIGCGVFAPLSVWSFLRSKDSYDKMVEAQSHQDSMPEFAKRFTGPEMLEIARKSYENRVPIFLLSLVGFALCTIGAIQMRKWKKTGFSIYLIGELLPLVVGFIFVGAGLFGVFAIIGYLIYATFIILYASQLKYLK